VARSGGRPSSGPSRQPGKTRYSENRQCIGEPRRQQILAAPVFFSPSLGASCTLLGPFTALSAEGGIRPDVYVGKRITARPFFPVSAAFGGGHGEKRKNHRKNSYGNPC
jgi:hypothetical protein